MVFFRVLVLFYPQKINWLEIILITSNKILLMCTPINQQPIKDLITLMFMTVFRIFFVYIIICQNLSFNRQPLTLATFSPMQLIFFPDEIFLNSAKLPGMVVAWENLQEVLVMLLLVVFVSLDVFHSLLFDVIAHLSITYRGLSHSFYTFNPAHCRVIR